MEIPLLLNQRLREVNANMHNGNPDSDTEEPVYKDIQISSIRNLESSFEGVKDGGGGF